MEYVIFYNGIYEYPLVVLKCFLMNKLKAMQVFVAVAQSDSFSAAAKQLNIGQATVSKHISALENSLHCQLIQRNTRQQTLTLAGQRYFGYVSRWLDELDAFESELDSRLTQATGIIKMTAPDPFASRVIVPLLADFYKLYPKIQIDMVLGERQYNLIKEGFDLAIRTKRQFEDSTLISRHLYDMSLWLVAAPDYLSKHQAITTPEMLEKHNFLSYRNTHSSGKIILHNRQRSVSVNVAGNLICNKGEVLLSAAIAGLGIAELPAWMITDEIKSGKLRRVLPKYTIPELPLKIVYPRRDNQPQRVKLFIHYLKENIRK